MDFTKLVSLISKEALFFARADKFDDPFEGSWPKKNVEGRKEHFKKRFETENSDKNLSDNISRMQKTMLTFTAINCWHQNDHESAAMWKSYLKSNEGIAVQTSFQDLKECLDQESEHDIFLGKVKYIDYQNDYIKSANLLSPYVHKRKSFKDEKEIRALIIKFPEGGNVYEDDPPFENGVYVKIDLDILINKIFVAPFAPNWLVDLVQDVLEKYGIDKDVVQSNINSSPVF
ncbi:DUF2971 domain-containing protein [Aliifodinibius sp. S!AR15-10]|uniref:DUF2971 domain-containing protein n=1 Tax=Aliifodinibius sp. S!AR15-10 TaxID=2950437 RepID=UPI002861A07B|nr:DUF2971 domain-containing protein [Aliifodinibius sp. S!AR15-10]MDR8394583.1 DUF2971 domain-containing protein [Aliifodinibius sp. S!AR15-10]